MSGPLSNATGHGQDATVSQHQGEAVTIMYSREVTFVKQIERKAKHIVANPEANIGDIVKKWRQSKNHNK